MSFEITIQIDPEMLKSFNKMTVVFSPQKAQAATSNEAPEITVPEPPYEASDVETLPTEPDAPEEAPQLEPGEIPKTEPKKETTPNTKPKKEASGVKETSLETLRAAVKEKAGGGAAAKDAIKAILSDAGYASVSEVPPEARGAVLERIRGL